MREALLLLEDKWNESGQEDEIDLLVRRSNLLGSDLRMTNYAGGNTSAKVELPDPLTGQLVPVLAVKGSGGDLGTIRREGFAQLYRSKLDSLRGLYRGPEHEDEMAALYPVCAFGVSGAPASIDTPLHAFLPFRHVEHLHPDWAIALAAAGNGESKLQEFNRRFSRNLLWIPWQRPGFELGLQMERALAAAPDCDGMILASHGLFTWGDTPAESYRNSIRTIDQLGVFVREHEAAAAPAFGGAVPVPKQDACRLIRELRDAMLQPTIAHFDGSDEVLEFVNSEHARELAARGTSCPDHFIRTRVAPLFCDGNLHDKLHEYRRQYAEYYAAHASPDSPAMRSPDPAVVLVPGAGMFTFARSKTEARITAEFYRNAIRVIRGATALAGGDPANYIALSAREAFRIEYWSLEEAKLRRMPREGLLARRIAWVPGDGDTRWIERLTTLGAQVSRTSALDTIREFGGIDIAVNAPEHLLAEARPRWIVRASSPDHLEVMAHAQAVSGS
ncbi:MAG TPA: class II aldolase/adducin family protein [Bryobacteraceae bacterium]|nr:class II aldolase/adducin family protein [Bryobacteraceae bacterium]